MKKIINLIGMSCCLAFTVWMTFVFVNLVVFGGVILIEPNIYISVFEFIIGIFSIIYCVLSLKKILGDIK